MSLVDVLLSSDLKDRIFVTKYTSSWPSSLRTTVMREYNNASLAWDTDNASPICIIFETNADLCAFTLKYGTELQ